MSDELTPITRKETFLAKAGGQNVVTPTPITREETFLQAIIDNGGGGGGTGGGVLVATGVVDIENMTITLDKSYNDITASPFTVVKIYEGNKCDIGSIYRTQHSNVTWGAYMWGYSDGNITDFVFEAESADDPLIYYMG